MLGKVFFSLVMAFGVASWFIWSLSTTDISERMQRACKPVQWTSSAFAAGLDVLYPPAITPTEEFFDKTDLVCRRLIWGVFYREDYQKEENLKLYYGRKQGEKEVDYVFE